MAKREDELPFYERHKSPAEVAEYMRNDGRYVGRDYETHGQIWDEKNELVQTGLLHLILDEIKLLSQGTDSGMHKHARFLEYYHAELAKLVSAYHKNYKRLAAMLRTEKLIYERHMPCLCISRFSYLYRKNFNEFFKEKLNLTKQVKLIRSIKSPAEIERLPGVGKKTAERLRKALEQ
jgi:Xaa-Pro aminopeptidase